MNISWFCSFISIFVLTNVLAAEKIKCLEAESDLMKYIKWQMEISNSRHNSPTPQKCQCKPKERRTIAFQIMLDAAMKNFPKEAVVKFDKVITNIGGSYNPSSGIFTCPEDGAYSFAWTTMTYSGSRFDSEFVVDGTVKAYNFNIAGNSHRSSSQTVVVKLKKGNKAWVRTYSTHGVFLEGRWSSFSGFNI
ncbi:Hypothetical predicted protein [Mytilus galloprovincialis]|uniref:C1q domain-containing protein n=1 Tax=Mytilus galloprovincialis TaxID=29158 RepID=A0A8B6E3D7_MYTGA|nr:Hypothetical predicted protein [Mytilus galloprovincialis]